MARRIISYFSISFIESIIRPSTKTCYRGPRQALADLELHKMCSEITVPVASLFHWSCCPSCAIPQASTEQEVPIFLGADDPSDLQWEANIMAVLLGMGIIIKVLFPKFYFPFPSKPLHPRLRWGRCSPSSCQEALISIPGTEVNRPSMYLW